jgi:hypothetical protein
VINFSCSEVALCELRALRRTECTRLNGRCGLSALGPGRSVKTRFVWDVYFGVGIYSKSAPTWNSDRNGSKCRESNGWISTRPRPYDIPESILKLQKLTLPLSRSS